MFCILKILSSLELHFFYALLTPRYNVISSRAVTSSFSFEVISVLYAHQILHQVILLRISKVFKDLRIIFLRSAMPLWTRQGDLSLNESSLEIIMTAIGSRHYILCETKLVITIITTILRTHIMSRWNFTILTVLWF
jgi:hypothetical protein